MNALLLHRSRSIPTPEHVAEMLRQNGYAASFGVEKGLSTKAVVVIGQSEAEITKIYYASDRVPIIVDFEADLWGFLHDYLLDQKNSGEITSSEIEGFIFVDAMEDADTRVFQLIIDYLSARTNVAMVFLNEYE